MSDKNVTAVCGKLWNVQDMDARRLSVPALADGWLRSLESLALALATPLLIDRFRRQLVRHAADFCFFHAVSFLLSTLIILLMFSNCKISMPHLWRIFGKKFNLMWLMTGTGPHAYRRGSVSRHI